MMLTSALSVSRDGWPAAVQATLHPFCIGGTRIYDAVMGYSDVAYSQADDGAYLHFVRDQSRSVSNHQIKLVCTIPSAG